MGHDAISDDRDPHQSTKDLNRRRFMQWTGAVGAALGLSGTSEALALASKGTTALTAQQKASRFLAQSTFGGDLTLINEVTDTGIANWLDAQMALPPSYLSLDVDTLLAATSEEGDQYFYFDWIWWQRAMTAPDQVRLRVAFALSQIFVVSRTIEEIFDTTDPLTSYHDLLMRHAFGNFRDLLRDIALHPAMGIYLSHAANRKSDPSLNRFPDENFAREVMQLFTIGLFELNSDGSQKLDPQGQPIPTYDNADITEMAKIFTGLTWAPEFPDEPIEFGEPTNWGLPMVMYEPEHEPGPKTPLGSTVPGGQTGMQDIEAAIDILFNHPNVGPFIGRLLIQRLVTSNPSPAYVARVAARFDDNGSGVRGDMRRVIRTILLDPEALDDTHIDDPHFGKVREPFTRWVQLGRAFHATSPSGKFRHFGIGEPGEPEDIGDYGPLAQYPFFSPSVFNFYSPNHQPAGALANADLVAPELEIVHSYTAVATMNHYHRAIHEGDYILDIEDFVGLDLSTEIALAASNPTALVDHLDLLLTYGTLSTTSRQTILDAILPLSEEPEDQVLMALFLMVTCPEYAVQR